MFPISSLFFNPRTALCVSRKCVANFQTCAVLSSEKKRTKTYKDMAQPILKPIGPQDYQRWKYFLNLPKEKPNIQPVNSDDEIKTHDIIDRVNEQIRNNTHRRLFAVVQVNAKQFKVTKDDIIVIQGTFEPEIGAEIRLEKVLLVGSSDFTLIGRPILDKSLVRIEATVMEKTLSQIVTHLFFVKRKRVRIQNFYRLPFTMLRINQILLEDTV